MKPSLKKFAPYGLYLALLAGLVSGGLYIVRRSFDLPLQISLGLIVVGLALYALLDPKTLRANLTGRQARYGSNTAILTIAFIGILVVVNVLVNNNSPRWDLTEDQQNTLAPETLNVIASLKSPVKAEAYFRVSTPSTAAADLLEKIKQAANGKFDYEFIDPDANPVRANNAKITADGTIVLVQDNRSEQVSFAGESEIVNGMVRLDNPGQRTVYFLSGHGEYDPEGSGDRSYAAVKQLLTDKNYTVKTLSLIADPQIPADALALVIAGPTKILAQEETTLIQSYLDQGGSLVLLSEPPVVTEFGDQSDPLAGYLQANWDILLGNDLVYTPTNNPPYVASSAAYGKHPITNKMQTDAVVLPTARSIQLLQSSSPDITLSPLVLTSQNSWAETSTAELSSNQVAFQQDQDFAGPVPVAVAAENAANRSRVVVVGDSDFAGDTIISQYGNRLFIINVIDWAAGQDDLINLTSRQATQRILIIGDQIALGLLLLGTIIVLPGAVVVGGIVVWLKRRRRG
jgi:ABC-type uncharacterized transport system involved in gliding motility auxiliary subunit